MNGTGNTAVELAERF